MTDEDDTAEEEDDEDEDDDDDDAGPVRGTTADKAGKSSFCMTNSSVGCWEGPRDGEGCNCG